MKEIKKTHKTKRTTTHPKIIVAVIVVSFLIGAIGLKVSGIGLPFAGSTDDSFSNGDQAGNTETTSDQPSAQADFNDGTERDPGNTLSEDKGGASIADTNGSPSSDTSNSIVSESGEITIYLPTKNSRVVSGQEISGTSTLPEVSYRIIDNVSGVIATGKLKTVGNNFSGRISFNTSANEGRIDIFGLREDAAEFSNIEIPIRFK